MPVQCRDPTAKTLSGRFDECPTLRNMKGSGMFRGPDGFMAAAPLAVLLAVTACVPTAPSQPTNQVPNQMIALPGGLKYADIKVGDGATAAAGHKVSMNYTGWLSNNGVKGRQFDSSFDHGQPFPLR
jgi:hypothetical protein